MIAIATRTRLSKEARRAQLIDKGKELLASRPLDQLTLEDVAVAAGISRALPFHYFASRRDFLLAVVESGSHELLTAGEVDPSLPPSEQLRVGLNGYIDYIERNAAAYMAVVRGAAGAESELVAVFERTRQTIVDRIREGFGAVDNAELLTLAIRGWMGMVEESTVAWLRDRGTVSREDLVGLLEEAFFRITTGIAGGDRPPESTP